MLEDSRAISFCNKTSLWCFVAAFKGEWNIKRWGVARALQIFRLNEITATAMQKQITFCNKLFIFLWLWKARNKNLTIFFMCGLDVNIWLKVSFFHPSRIWFQIRTNEFKPSRERKARWTRVFVINFWLVLMENFVAYFFSDMVKVNHHGWKDHHHRRHDKGFLLFIFVIISEAFACSPNSWSYAKVLLASGHFLKPLINLNFEI
jgi:hypothetical protein